MFAPIQKLIVAAVGVGVFFLKDHVGLDLTEHTDAIVNLIISGLTAVSVWAVPSKAVPAPVEPSDA